jgi:hypothetical protein
MSRPEAEEREPMEANGPAAGHGYRRAVRTGAKRAALHMVRAGYEVVAGVGAFLEEVVRARSGEGSAGDEAGDALTRPTRIPLD